MLGGKSDVSVTTSIDAKVATEAWPNQLIRCCKCEERGGSETVVSSNQGEI